MRIVRRWTELVDGIYYKEKTMFRKVTEDIFKKKWSPS